MSDSNDKENLRKLTIHLKENVYKRLEAQINFMKEIGIPELKDVSTIEDLVCFYIEQLSIPSQNLEDMHRKIESVLTIFQRKGINMKALLNAFTFEDLDDEYDFEDEEEDEEEQEKKKKARKEKLN